MVKIYKLIKPGLMIHIKTQLLNFPNVTKENVEKDYMKSLSFESEVL